MIYIYIYICITYMYICILLSLSDHVITLSVPVEFPEVPL